MEEPSFYLAKPDDPEAARAIARSQQPDLAMTTWLPLGGFGIIAFIAFMRLFLDDLAENWWFVAAFLIAVAGGVGFMCYKFVVPSKGSLEHAIEAGNVIVVDSYLVEAWDQLRKRLNLKLTRPERRQALNNLFDVAQELGGKLQRYRELENEPELQDERLEVEAYIRARLLRNVQELAAYRQGAQELEQIAARLELPAVSPEEVAAELAILKGEQPEAGDKPLT